MKFKFAISLKYIIIFVALIVTLYGFTPVKNCSFEEACEKIFSIIENQQGYPVDVSKLFEANSKEIRINFPKPNFLSLGTQNQENCTHQFFLTENVVYWRFFYIPVQSIYLSMTYCATKDGWSLEAAELNRIGL